MKADRQEKDQKSATKPTPVPVKKDRPKGSWGDEWEMTPSQQREFMESKAEREGERGKRLLYRVCHLFPPNLSSYLASSLSLF